MPGFARLVAYMTWRRLLELVRYKTNLLFGLISPLIWSAAFLLLVPIYSMSDISTSIGTTNYGAYLLLGLSMISLQSIALWDGANNFNWELTTGLIDYSFSSPISKYAYIEAVIISDALISVLVYDLPFLLIAFYLSRSTISAIGFVLGMSAYGLSVLALSQMGVTFSALTLQYKNVSNLFEFINMAFQFLTGMIIPLQVLPLFVRDASAFIPLTFGMDLSRHYILFSSTVFPIWLEWSALVVQLLVMGALSVAAFNFVESSSRKNGLHYVRTRNATVH